MDICVWLVNYLDILSKCFTLTVKKSLIGFINPSNGFRMQRFYSTHLNMKLNTKKIPERKFDQWMFSFNRWNYNLKRTKSIPSKNTHHIEDESNYRSWCIYGWQILQSHKTDIGGHMRCDFIATIAYIQPTGYFSIKLISLRIRIWITYLLNSSTKIDDLLCQRHAIGIYRQTVYN